MARPSETLTGVERFFAEKDLIVSKTDTKGRITYANRTFRTLAGYSEAEVIGKPHNLIRHPGMPRCVFKLLWDTLEAKREIFAYVVNRSANGDHYWVLAHVTPSLDTKGRVVGYHSNRRVPKRTAIDAVTPIYRQLLDIEARHAGDPKAGLTASFNAMLSLLQSHGVTYDQFIFSL